MNYEMYQIGLASETNIAFVSEHIVNGACIYDVADNGFFNNHPAFAYIKEGELVGVGCRMDGVDEKSVGLICKEEGTGTKQSDDTAYVFKENLLKGRKCIYIKNKEQLRELKRFVNVNLHATNDPVNFTVCFVDGVQSSMYSDYCVESATLRGYEYIN